MNRIAALLHFHRILSQSRAAASQIELALDTVADDLRKTRHSRQAGKRIGLDEWTKPRN
jgi:hypothetical protein